MVNDTEVKKRRAGKNLLDLVTWPPIFLAIIVSREKKKRSLVEMGRVNKKQRSDCSIRKLDNSFKNWL